jgi:hypothetical protein
MASFSKPGPNGGRLLPEIVRVIGVTPFEDQERWMVVRGTYIAANCRGEALKDRSKCEWVPYPREAIKFVGCGPEAAGYATSASERGPVTRPGTPDPWEEGE